MRLDGRDFTLGVLVLANFGNAGDLVLPDGRRPVPPVPTPAAPERGSVIIVLATDLPLESRQLNRVARRCGAGLARLSAPSGAMAVAISPSPSARRVASPITRQPISCR